MLKLIIPANDPDALIQVGEMLKAAPKIADGLVIVIQNPDGSVSETGVPAPVRWASGPAPAVAVPDTRRFAAVELKKHEKGDSVFWTQKWEGFALKIEKTFDPVRKTMFAASINEEVVGEWKKKTDAEAGLKIEALNRARAKTKS